MRGSEEARPTERHRYASQGPAWWFREQRNEVPGDENLNAPTRIDVINANHGPPWRTETAR